MKRLIKTLMKIAVLSLVIVVFIYILVQSAHDGTKKRSLLELESKKTATEQKEEDVMRGKFTSANERLESMKKVAEDKYTRLFVDETYAEIAVQDIQTGLSWFSNPYDFSLDAKSSIEIKSTLQSILRLSYIDSTSKEYVMNSYDDSIKKNQFSIEKIPSGVAINLQMGRLQDGTVLPDAAEANRFEEKVLSQLSDKDARKIKAFFTKVSLEDPQISNNVKESYLAYYPGLKDQDFYILRTSAVDREKKMLEQIILKTEYTKEDYAEDKELSGYVSEDSITALFQVRVEFTLDNGDLIVNIPNEKLGYDGEAYTLTKFTLLEFFGAGKSENEGYLMIPDGSGAINNYNTNAQKSILYTKNTVYGRDYTYDPTYFYNSLSEQTYLPVFGNKQTNFQAIFGIIEEADSLANIVSQSGNIVSGYESVYPEFIFHPTNTTNYTDAVKIKGFFTYSADKAYTGNYKVRYQLLTNHEANYVGMAKSYQNYLVEHQQLTKMSEEEAKAKVYMETLGAIEKKSTKLGFPYTKSIPLTTFKQAKQMIEDLKENGLDSVALRYRGWENKGLYHSVSNEVNVVKSLGGKKQLINLENYMKGNGMKLFPDVDFMSVRNDIPNDGYTESKNAAQTLAKEKLWIMNPNEITSLDYIQFAFYSVSPYYFDTYMKDYFTEFDKLKLSGVSIGNYGNMLYSEFKKSKALDREEVKQKITKNTGLYTDNLDLMIDGGNSYMFPYASDIVNLPLSNSNHTLEDESIPFIQLVLHGFIPYAGSAMNLASDIDTMFLKSIEYGSNLFYTIAYDNIGELKSTVYTYNYSIGYDTWREKIIDYSKKFSDAYDGISHLAMVSHDKIDEGIYQTVYDNGTRFIVNYTKADVTIDGNVITAGSYIKLEP